LGWRVAVRQHVHGTAQRHTQRSQRLVGCVGGCVRDCAWNQRPIGSLVGCVRGSARKGGHGYVIGTRKCHARCGVGTRGRRSGLSGIGARTTMRRSRFSHVELEQLATCEGEGRMACLIHRCTACARLRASASHTPAPRASQGRKAHPSVVKSSQVKAGSPPRRPHRQIKSIQSSQVKPSQGGLTATTTTSKTSARADGPEHPSMLDRWRRSQTARGALACTRSHNPAQTSSHPLKSSQVKPSEVVRCRCMAQSSPY
jgi:hypothetical protein